ncbi:MAG: AAA family ATPase [Candidatus Methylarchaceae archaeon HK02M2]|nr:AAA family ATPase [Candidatus Methylarchaceae archaeon HK02M2]
MPVERIRVEYDPKLMGCESTEEIEPLKEIIGQERAVKALKFGLDIKERGFNIYAAGFPGSGRKTAVKDFLEELATGKPVPPDWCYVNNFNNTFVPRAIKLPSGRGKDFQKDMKNFIDEARSVLPKAFESEDYATKKENVIRDIEEERKVLLAQLNERAQKEGFVLRSTPIGVVTIPVLEGKLLSDKDIMTLSPEMRDKIQKKMEKLKGELRSAFRRLRGLERKINEEIQKLNREVAIYTIGHMIDDLMDKYQKFSEVKTYLEELKNDLLENLTIFITEPKAPPSFPFPIPWMKDVPFKKYEVNVITDNSNLKGAPVVMELNPTHQNLFGRIEKEAQFGVLTTDFTMVRGGSLHKANGGYLVIPAEEVLSNIFSYDSLKRALMNECITIEEAGERLGYITTKGLRPEPIPLDVKVVLIGTAFLYHQLYLLDKDFKELFKVKADFNTTMDRTDENVKKYAAFVCTISRKEGLKNFDASGVAKVVEYGSRIAEDQKKLSTRFGEIADIIREANFYATQSNSKYVTAEHIKKAIDEKVYRSNLIQEKIQEMIKRNVLLIDTDGEAVGQVNGLSVIGLGDFAFGRPSRVTASIGLGREGLIDIEREAKLGGRIHTKGVMILSGYLAEKYAQDKPLSLSARLVFEQSYGMVEGDSASSTELYALLSILSGLPIKQSIAVTGSVNQKGEVQAIGGVNEKIEGFFEVCKAKGFNGEQGVIIPESNVQNLMLKEEVVEAVREEKFHIYPVETIDQGIEVLTDVKAGVKRSDGTFEEGSVNHRVDRRLKTMAEKLREFPELLVEGRKVEGKEEED